MSKTLEDVRETLTGQPRRRWWPWHRKTLGEQVGEKAGQVGEAASDIAGQVGQTASDLAGKVGLRKRPPAERVKTAASDVAGLVGQTSGELFERASGSALDLVDQAPASAQVGPRWLPWRRKTLGERVAETAGQVGGTTSDIASRATGRTTDLARRATAQTSAAASGLQRRAASTVGKITERFSGTPAAEAEEMPGYAPVAPVRWYQPVTSAADLSAERAAVAAEAASDAAQRAVGLMERVGTLLRVQASRAALPAAPVAVPVSQAVPSAVMAGSAALPEALRAEEEEQAGPGRKVASTLKRTVTRVGERINELSDGRFGLEPTPPKEEKKAPKRLQRQERKAAKQAEKPPRMSGLAWAIGLSLGLALGLLGVAYWQRRRLQKLWGETSQRMQQATEDLRQRFDTQRGKISPPATEWTVTPEARPAGQAETTSGTATFTQLGSSTPATDLGQQTNGKVESGTQ